MKSGLEHQRMHADGVAAGKRWAQEGASYEEIERVATLIENIGVLDQLDHFGAGGQIAKAILGDGDHDVGMVLATMERVVGSDDLDFAVGFIESVHDVYTQV